MAVVGHEGFRERLTEYSAELYNAPFPAERFHGGGLGTLVAPDQPV